MQLQWWTTGCLRGTSAQEVMMHLWGADPPVMICVTTDNFSSQTLITPRSSDKPEAVFYGGPESSTYCILENIFTRAQHLEKTTTYRNSWNTLGVPLKKLTF